MDTITQKPIVIYAESTPNPAAMKFVANKLLVTEKVTLEYLTAEDAKSSPLAIKLFQFPFVKAILITSNCITITKKDFVSWDDITLELREFLKEYLTNGGIVFTELPTKKEVFIDSSFTKTTATYTEHSIPKTEIETKIIEILEQYIRPAVEQDGGLITFQSFNEGIVTVSLKGACSGCPSSTVTLKAGIEGLLKRMIPEVKEVVAEAL